jgi:hypothetical protein
MALATPRNIVGYDETAGPHDLTFIADNSTIVYDGTQANGAPTTMIGKAVTLSADNTAALCADGDAVLGKLISVDSDGKCSVRVHGYVDLPGGASATLTRGVAVVGALGAASAKGYVRIAASATAAELVKARGLIINNGTTTAVGILLD